MWRFIVMCMLCFSVVLAAFFWGSYLYRFIIGSNPEKTSSKIATWIQCQNLTPGTYSLALPLEFQRDAADGTVYVYVRSDNAFSFLIKTHLTYKSGYRGYLYWSLPFKDDLVTVSYDDFDHGNYHKNMPTIPFVDRCISDHLLEVYVDG